MARKDKGYDGNERRGPNQLLVVNDDTDASELLSRLLAREGYRVATSNSIDGTLTKMLELLPRGVVLDLTQGGVGSNLKLLENIRHHSDERVSTARVILVARQAANRVFSFQSGADAFLVRPFHAKDLLEAVEKVLAMPFNELPQHRRAELDRA